MSNYEVEARIRKRTLLIVEGKHEKNELFRLIFKCFPEIGIDMDMDSIWIYGTNIYLLHHDLVDEYGEAWASDGLDIDLPFVISKKQTPGNLRYKEDFTNIILVFDYERHDTNFAENKIMEMQNSFSDAADMGKLYINYPMLESYQHLRAIPDPDYAERKIPVSLKPGSEYKAVVEKESKIGEIVGFPHRIDDLLKGRFGLTNTEIRDKCCESILQLSDAARLEENLQKVLENTISDDKQKTTLKYQLKAWINKIGYINSGQTYRQYARNLIVEIICHNIRKANRIQNEIYEIEPEQYKEAFEGIDLGKILIQQNLFSRAEDGFIWVLNTCVFVVADYNFSLVRHSG